MRVIIHCLAFILVFNSFAQSPSLEWSRGMGGASPQEGFSITVDGAGNVYTTGYFYGTSDFDPGIGVYNLTSTAYYSLFVQKMDVAGNFLWAKTIEGGTSSDVNAGNSIAVDAFGNVYVTGYFSGTIDFDSGSGTNILTAAGAVDIFIMKLATNGDFLWAKRMGGSGIDEGHSIVLDAVGNIYTIGNFEYTVDFDPGQGISNLTGVGDDVFIQKLDANGDFLWAKRMGGNSIDYGRSIAVDASGNVYTTGAFTFTADFDPGSGTHNLVSSGSYDAFISKLDENGNFLWAKSFGGAGEDFSFSIAIDNISGSIYTTGHFEGTVDFDPGQGISNLTANGNADIFIQKLDANGNFLWAQNFGDISGSGEGSSITVDNFGNSYSTGYFVGEIDFNFGAGETIISSTGIYSDVFILKLNSYGDFQWVEKSGTKAEGHAIFTDDYGKIYVTGGFSDTANFGSQTENIVSGGWYRHFCCKIWKWMFSYISQRKHLCLRFLYMGKRKRANIHRQHHSYAYFSKWSSKWL